MADAPAPGLHGVDWLHHPNCWGCGPVNDGGLGLPVERDPAGGFRARFAVPTGMHGPPGRVHGGLLAVPMDCLASWAAIDTVRRRAAQAGRDPDRTIPLTGTYEVRLVGPVPTGVTLDAVGRVEREEGRKLFVHSSVSRDGDVLATFDSVFVEVSVDRAAPPS